METVIISNTEDRVIQFGIAEPERYITGGDTDTDPWWNVCVFVKKPGIEINAMAEAMTTLELLELSRVIKETRRKNDHKNIYVDFMEPDYAFDISGLHGILHINLRYADSLDIWLTKENMDDIANYIDAKIEQSNS